MSFEAAMNESRGTGAPVAATYVYAVTPGAEAAFRDLVRDHGAALRRHHLVTATPPRVLGGTDCQGRLWIVERFEWVDAGAARRAWAVAEIRARWVLMESLLAARGVLPVPRPPVRPTEAGPHLHP